MKFTVVTTAAAVFLGVANAMQLTFYNGRDCRGARLTSESRGRGGCHGLTGVKANTASIFVTVEGGDGSQDRESDFT